MKQNEFSSNELSLEAMEWVTHLYSHLKMKFKGAGTIRNYCGELTLLLKYYHFKTVEQITEQDIRNYMLYIQEVHKVGRAKCRSVASACSYTNVNCVADQFLQW